MIINKFFKKVYHLIYPPRARFKHGQRFYSNSLIDTLFPELVEIGDDFISGSIVHHSYETCHVTSERLVI